MYMYMYIQDNIVHVHSCTYYVPTLILYSIICIPLSVVGAKELNLAATVEHLRDHRPRMVHTKVLEHVYTVRSKLTL